MKANKIVLAALSACLALALGACESCITLSDLTVRPDPVRKLPQPEKIPLNLDRMAFHPAQLTSQVDAAGIPADLRSQAGAMAVSELLDKSIREGDAACTETSLLVLRPSVVEGEHQGVAAGFCHSGQSHYIRLASINLAGQASTVRISPPLAQAAGLAGRRAGAANGPGVARIDKRLAAVWFADTLADSPGAVTNTVSIFAAEEEGFAEVLTLPLGLGSADAGTERTPAPSVAVVDDVLEGRFGPELIIHGGWTTVDGERKPNRLRIFYWRKGRFKEVDPNLAVAEIMHQALDKYYPPVVYMALAADVDKDPDKIEAATELLDMLDENELLVQRGFQVWQSEQFTGMTPNHYLLGAVYADEASAMETVDILTANADEVRLEVLTPNAEYIKLFDPSGKPVFGEFTTGIGGAARTILLGERPR